MPAMPDSAILSCFPYHASARHGYSSPIRGPFTAIVQSAEDNPSGLKKSGFQVVWRKSMSHEAANHHKQAAEHLEHAARHHHEAAAHHQAGEHEKAAHHAHLAHGHHVHAADHAEHAVKHHVEAHGEK